MIPLSQYHWRTPCFLLQIKNTTDERLKPVGRVPGIFLVLGTCGLIGCTFLSFLYRYWYPFLQFWCNSGSPIFKTWFECGFPFSRYLVHLGMIFQNFVMNRHRFKFSEIWFQYRCILVLRRHIPTQDWIKLTSQPIPPPHRTDEGKKDEIAICFVLDLLQLCHVQHFMSLCIVMKNQIGHL